MNAKLLVVEDSPAQRFLLTKILEEKGFEVVAGQNGREALTILEEFRPNAIISDIMMPEMDGITLSTMLKKDERFNGVPVVLMTSLNEPEEIIRIINSQADYLFLKDFDPDAFGQFIEDIVRSAELEQPEDNESVLISYLRQIQKINTSRPRAVRLLLSVYRSAVQAYERYYRLKHEYQELQNSVKKQLQDVKQRHTYRYAQISLLLEEIRTPLNNLFNIFELLQSLATNQEEDVYLQLANINSEHISKVLDDLQKIAHFKSTHDQLPLQSIPFNLRECVEDTLSPFAVLAGKKQIDLISYLANDIPQFVIGEPHYLRHVLFILIDNACKFTEQGDIVVDVRKVDEDGDNVLLKFSVKDTGVGIKPAKEVELKKLFRDVGQTANPGISSLLEKNPGLFVAARLIHTLKGEIDFTTGAEGSEFYFTLPFQVGEVPPEIIRLNTGTSLKDVPTLILSEQWLNGVVLEELLRSWGANVKVVKHPEAALESLLQAQHNKHPYRVFILDGDSGSGSAFKIMENITRYPELSDLKKILLTSFGQRGDASKCLEYGVHAFLLKPIKAKELLHTIQAVLQMPGASKMLITRHTIKESARPLRIIVAEDNRVNQKLITTMLKKEGFDVEVAANGQEAIDLLKKKAADLILMDMQMPIMDGFQATREIRKLDEKNNQHTLIFALTASDDPVEIQGAINAGVDEVMRKPLNLLAFKDILKKYLQDSKTVIIDG